VESAPSRIKVEVESGETTETLIQHNSFQNQTSSQNEVSLILGMEDFKKENLEECHLSKNEAKQSEFGDLDNSGFLNSPALTKTDMKIFDVSSQQDFCETSVHSAKHVEQPSKKASSTMRAQIECIPCKVCGDRSR
jgi:hypothetical protein